MYITQAVPCLKVVRGVAAAGLLPSCCPGFKADAAPIRLP